jgi:hypothetical protein
MPFMTVTRCSLAPAYCSQHTGYISRYLKHKTMRYESRYDSFPFTCWAPDRSSKRAYLCVSSRTLQASPTSVLHKCSVRQSLVTPCCKRKLFYGETMKRCAKPNKTAHQFVLYSGRLPSVGFIRNLLRTDGEVLAAWMGRPCSTHDNDQKRQLNSTRKSWRNYISLQNWTSMRK